MTTSARFQGVLQIVRFNWPQYAMAAAIVASALIAATLIPLTPRTRLYVLVAALCAAYWPTASLIVSWLVYDRSPLRKWSWIAESLHVAPARWLNLHAGLDESTPALRRMFPAARGRVLDIFDPAEMTERSIVRARDLSTSPEPCERADYRDLPLADASCDAAMLLFSAHELRHHASRLALFRELHRVLTPGGRVVLAEHLRDVANFLAFGPGCLHFHSRRAWLAAVREGGFDIENDFSITPFVAVFILKRRST